mgnify:CR=1 FL=1
MKKIKVFEVGPRDGYQNVSALIPTQEKKKIIDGLAKSGVTHLQVTSFVSPKAVPQMQDAREVAVYCKEHYPKLDILALVPNLRGAKDACDAGIRHISYVVSLSESHNKANVNRTREASVRELKEIAFSYPDMKICVDVATAFGCPFEGKPADGELIRFVGELYSKGFREICLCDTTGVANPRQVREAVSAVMETYPDIEPAVHIHDTRGMGLACTLAAVEAGVSRIQSTLGGLGGCPFAPGASGNTATEDLVYMFREMGYETGIDFEELLKLSKYQKSVIEGNYSGHHVMITAPQACGKRGGR